MALEGLPALRYHDLLEFDRLVELLGLRRVNPLDTSVQPRGYRVLSHIPRIPEPVIRRVVGQPRRPRRGRPGLPADLEAVEGVGAVRAREIREGLSACRSTTSSSATSSCKAYKSERRQKKVAIPAGF